MIVPVLSKILIYPIKGLDPVEVKEAETTGKGSLRLDRFIVLFDEKGKKVSGKREKTLHRIRAVYDLYGFRAMLTFKDQKVTLDLDDDRSIGSWFSEVLGYRVVAKKFPEGYPDDKKAHGPTLVSRESLKEIAGWYQIDEENVRRRFRANLEIEGVPPFWEDSLVGEDYSKRFRIGEVIFSGDGISKRCPVPTRDPYTGEELRGFVRVFTALRKERLPEWSPKKRFEDTLYRLCINTSVIKGGTLRVGDELKLVQ